MLNIGTNQILLLSCVLLVIGAGTYLTYFQQGSTLEELDAQIEEQEEELQEIEALQDDIVEADERLQTVRQEWNNRYKVIPETISSPDIVEYLNRLTQSGFKSFDVVSAGEAERDGYAAHTFSAEGRAFFRHLYEFVWAIENNRSFYRIRDLNLSYLEERETEDETGRTSMDVLVAFQMDVEALYGVTEGIGGEGEPGDTQELEDLPVAQASRHPPVPDHVLPDPSPDIDPFYPLVFEQVPPNEHGRLNVEASELMSVAGNEAVFRTGDGIERVQEGDRVYLGEIIEVDADDGRVVARLNKGGIVDDIEIHL